MPAPISYPTKRGIVFYCPPATSSDRAEPVRLPSPPCRPRIRRPHSIYITRLPSPITNPRSTNSALSTYSSRSTLTSRPQVKCRDLKRIVLRETAKRVLASIVSLISKSSPAHETVTAHNSNSSKLFHHFESARSALTVTSLPQDTRSRENCSLRTGWTRTETDMLRLSLGENSWRPTTNAENLTPRNSVSLPSPRSSLTGISNYTLPRLSTDSEKPLASGNGVSCYILMAEPVIFLMGLDHDGTTRDSHGANATALLRGTLRLNVTKSTKIKSVSLKFTGKARTLWPEGIPPLKQDTIEESSLRTQVIPFFNAVYEGSESRYGNLCTYTLRDGNSTLPSNNINYEFTNPHQSSSFSLSGITNRLSALPQNSEGRRSSVQSIQSKNFLKGEAAPGSSNLKGYKIFYPGVYDYSFELPIDNNMPESTNLPLANVKWELEATVERAGTFKANLSGKREIPVIRSPSQDSLELVEPIAVSRTWDQQLHYDIVISGKSFPIGTKIPIAFKLTPLAKVQVHKVKVYLTENIDYYARDKSVQRKDVKRKMLLLEKSAGKPVSKEFWPSEVRIIGGEHSAEEREMRRSIAMRRREVEAQRNNSQATPLPECVDNLLGDIDLGVDDWLGPTEIEMNVQLPTCDIMEKDRSKRLAHDCTWKNVQVHHWLKILIRLSRADVADPSRRRHYEISVDSPISLLNCRASQANISLPEYSGLNPDTLGPQQICGCTSTTQAAEALLAQTSSNDNHIVHENTRSTTNSSSLAIPAQVYLSTGMAEGFRRPIHLVRSPSFQPPPFDAEEPPPPITTPPPLYDHVIGTPSHDGLADYFARLDAYEDELTDEEDNIPSVRHGSVVSDPRTAANHMPRVIELNRDFIFSTTSTNSIMAGIDSGFTAS
ncbi:unnamed protein product [Blumeria hordei]|uniref:Arrestin C-terminal-like domain-containing protein n=1 Tax=Blumeria hordei TaxID=2867405 RepID=A0A383UT42_BLUHO|nr:unnamed protein product [Blumeria hordei]